MSIDVGEAQSLLYREARLLDERCYEEWLDLLTDDATYWIPCTDDGDPATQVSIAYDDRARLVERVTRLVSGHAHAQDPPSRTARVVSNVEVLPGEGHRDGEVFVASAFVLVEHRLDRQHLFGGRYRHRLRRGDGGWRIAAKEVGLVNRDSAIDNLTFIV